MKRITSLLVCFAMLGLSVFAQDVQITGKVTSADDGSILPGVSVVVKGTTTGTTTTIDGEYTISASPEATLVFSFVGMKSQEVVVGSQTTIDVSMEMDVTGLEEVVVTALGIKTNKDKLTGAVTSVNTDDLQRSGESGLIQGLSGKTSGLSISRSTGDPGAGAYIQIRGQNTITGSNQPLIIVDGVPMTNTSRGGDIDGVVQQSRLNDINPNDIASIDVLKGASAAAIWGTRAANGVIVITTKKGQVAGGKRVGVDLWAGFSWDQINVEFEKQDKFGQGRYGSWEPNRGESWGDKLSDRAGGADEVDMTGPYFAGYDGNMIYPIVTKNDNTVYNDANRDQVFQTGFATDLGAGISIAGADGSNTYISLSDWNQDGIIKGNSDYRRSTVRFNYESSVTEKVSFRFTSFYSKISSNRIQMGSNLNGLYLGYLRTSPDFDNTTYIGTYYNAAGEPTINSHRSYRNYMGSSAPTYSNPGWTIHEQVNTSEVDRLTIAPELSWEMINTSKVTSKLTARYGIDYAADKRETFFPVNSASSVASGSYTLDWLMDKQSTANIFARTLHTFDQGNFSWVIGGQYNVRTYERSSGDMYNFINTVDQIYDFSNATVANQTPDKYYEQRRMTGGYLVGNLELLDQFIVEATGRVEQSSGYKGTIFYPSASAAWQFTKMLGTSNALTFGKLRLAYGTVGIEPPAYILGDSYVTAGTASGWGAVLDAGYYGGGLQRSTTQGNPDIKPEKKTEFEIGTDLRLLRDYLTVNFTFYTNTITDAIFAVDVPASTGYTDKWDNAAELKNTGIELDVVGNIINNKDLKWSINANFSKNKNEVTDLKGVQSIFLQGFTGTSSRAVEGEALGALWGGKYDRDETGALILDANGFPTQALDEGVLGDPNPDWRGALGTNLSFKGVNFNILFETSQGGDIWAGTSGVLKHFGIDPETATEVTLTEDVVNYWGDTYLAGETVRGSLKDFGDGPVLLDQAWYTGLGGGFGPIAEDFIEDASWTKLREISLGYTFPNELTSKIGLTDLTITAIGRNLFTWTNVKGFDPETNLTGVTNGRGLEYFNNPGTRSYLLKLQLSF